MEGVKTVERRNYLEAIRIIRQEVKVVSAEGVAVGTREVDGIKRDQKVVSGSDWQVRERRE